MIKKLIVENKRTIHYIITDRNSERKILLYNDTYDVKDILKQYGFYWDSVERSWTKKDFIDSDIVEMFNILQNMGIQILRYSSTYKGGSSLLDEPLYGWTDSISEVPDIPNGNGQNIIYTYYSAWGIDTLLFRGNGTKQIKEYLKYFYFEYRSDLYAWELMAANVFDISKILNDLQNAGYTMIQKMTDRSIDIPNFTPDKIQGNDVVIDY